jgi:hypothetical protein
MGRQIGLTFGFGKAARALSPGFALRSGLPFQSERRGVRFDQDGAMIAKAETHAASGRSGKAGEKGQQMNDCRKRDRSESCFST